MIYLFSLIGHFIVLFTGGSACYFVPQQNKCIVCGKKEFPKEDSHESNTL